MKKILVIGLSLVLMAFMSASVLVAQEQAGGKEKAACPMGKAAGEMDKGTCGKDGTPAEGKARLTPEQKAKIEDLRMDFRLKLIDLKAEREKLAIMLGKELRKSEPDMQAIEGIVKKMSPVREKIQLAAIEQGLAMRKLLGPEWRTLMRPAARERRVMRFMPGRDTDEMEGGEGSWMGPDRMMRMRMERGPEGNVRWMERTGPGAETGAGPMTMGSRAMMRRGAMAARGGAMMGGRMMRGPAMGARGMGEMEEGCGMMEERHECHKGGSASCDARMFRPFGKKSSCSLSCEMHRGAGGDHRGMMEMRSRGMKAGASKEMKCKIEIKKESRE
jgi:hypothetical protein